MPLPPGYNPFANQGGNLHAGIDPTTGNPFYLAGYDANNQPVWSWSPTFNPAEHPAGLNRSIGHFADAMASGGQFGQLGEFISNAQGSMYTPNTGLSGPPLQQTGTYAMPGSGNAGVNPALTNNQPPPVTDQQPPPDINRQQGRQTVPNPNQGSGVVRNQGQPAGSGFNAGQNDPYAFFTGGQSQRSSTNPYVNQSGPYQGGASNYAVYGSPGRTSRVPWQSRLQGGGGAAGDNSNRSASRLF